MSEQQQLPGELSIGRLPLLLVMALCLGLPTLSACTTGSQDASTGGRRATATGSASGRAGNQPTQTRIVDNFEQVVDVQGPRFAWMVNDSARAQAQTAYQIIVATDEAAIAANRGTLWDSGKVAAAQQHGVAYAGPALTKTSKYWWKVRTWNKGDRASAWSAANTFVTGFFQPTDWDRGAQWIRHPKAVSRETDAPPMFRKSFTVTKPVKQAFLYVTGLGQFVASVNGKKVGNHEIDPAWTDYDHTMNYVTFDVTQSIVRGANAIGVMLGTGWLNAEDRVPLRPLGVMRMLAQLHVVYKDGTSMEVVSDPTWKASASPFTFTELHGKENYDARMLPAGWNTGTFDDSAWVAAAAATAPPGVLSAQSAPPVMARETLSAVNITNPAANTFIFDFGRNMNGQFEITVSGKAGATVSLTAGEFLSDEKVNPGRSGTNTYTLRGGGPETWRLSFSTIGMRYLQVGGVARTATQTELPHLMDAKAYVTYTGSNSVGTFMASDARYNKIYDLAQRTLQSNITSLHTDGPNYEKLGWQEVVWTTLPSNAYQLDVENLFTKILRDNRDSQRTSGQSPSISPNPFYTKSSASRSVFDDAPAWGSSAIQAPWMLYNIYGDTRVLQDNYVMMKASLAYLKTREAGGLVSYGLGDWMAPGGTSVPNVEGAVYVSNTRVMRDVAAALGNSADAAFYAAEFTRVQKAYNNAYFDRANSRYTPVSQANIALPLAFGIVPAGSEAAVASSLLKNIAAPMEKTATGGFGEVLANHVTTGDIGTTFLWRTLGDFNQADLVQTMITQPTVPSYLAMINGGETTIAEKWNFSGTRSHNHDMYAGILEWFYRSLGGISSSKPGYAEIQLKPAMPTGLASVSVSYNSVRGPIKSAWNRGSGKVQWNVTVPVNATAKVYLPTFTTAASGVTVSESGATIFKNGTASGGVPGVTFDHIEGVSPAAFVVFAVGSGNYQFAWNAQ
ncbi:MAG: family 78 glycoside hydrolase catalytic domain [Steroidobacteraceae bacterium]